MSLPPSILFGINVAFGFLAWGIVIRRYVWPALRDLPRAEALRPVLVLHSFRFLGLAFLIPGVVSPALSAGFAAPAAYGDLATAVLALLGLATMPGALGIVVVWIFNVVGAADLLHAFYAGSQTGVGADPGLQGAAYFIPTFFVPLLLITHGMVFRLLLRNRAAVLAT